MQTFQFEKTPIVPPHCLWVSGLLLISGCRAGAGWPHLQSASYPAGNRLAMGDKAPGAWGAPGADPLLKVAARLASIWAGGNGVGAETAQSTHGSVSLHAGAFLLWGAVSSPVLPSRERNGKEVVSDAAGVSKHAPGPAGWLPISTVGVTTAMPMDESCKKKIIFVPKPDPWSSTNAAGGAAFKSVRPASFCRRIVTFTPTPNPAC